MSDAGSSYSEKLGTVVKSFENVAGAEVRRFNSTDVVDVIGLTSTFFLSVQNMEPSSTEGGAEETLLKNHPPNLVSAEIK